MSFTCVKLHVMSLSDGAGASEKGGPPPGFYTETYGGGQIPGTSGDPGGIVNIQPAHSMSSSGGMEHLHGVAVSSADYSLPGMASASMVGMFDTVGYSLKQEHSLGRQQHMPPTPPGE